MSNIRLGYIEGFLEGTLGSPREYTIDDYKRRIAYVIAYLKDDEKEVKRLAELDEKRQIELDKEMI